MNTHLQNEKKIGKKKQKILKIQEKLNQLEKETTQHQKDQSEDQENKQNIDNQTQAPEEIQNHSEKSDFKNVHDIYAIAKENYGSIYNLLGLGGPGTYCLLGPTESGKSFCIKQLYYYATSAWVPEDRKIHFTCMMVISSTSKITKDFDWNSSLIHMEASDDVIYGILKTREQEMEDAMAKAGRPLTHAEEWAEENPILVVLDDTYGLLDFTTPGNPSAGLATKARHYGIYFVLAVQYMKQLGPVFRDNARMWICIQTNMKDHKEITDNLFGKHNELAAVARKNNYRAYFCSVYVITWRFKREFGVPAGRLLLLTPFPDASKLVVRQLKPKNKLWNEIYRKIGNDEEEFEE